jgi:hypothetical protein
MPYSVELERDEQLIGTYTLTIGRKAEPFAFAVSTQALFLPTKKFFAAKDPTYFERVPVGSVREVRIRRLRPHAMLVLAAIMVAAGMATTFLMVRPLLNGEAGKVSGYPPAIVVVGLVIPFAIRGRYGLVVTYGDKRFRWKPTIAVDKKSRTATKNFITEIADACRVAKCNVTDERMLQPGASAQT